MPLADPEVQAPLLIRSAKRAFAELKRFQSLIVSVVGGVATMAALGVALNQFSQQGTQPLVALVSSGFAFWAAFAAMMLVEPVAGYWIMRRQLGTGLETMGPLLRKQSLNMLLFSCAGDTLFLAWLQKHLGNTKTALALVCDMAIISALVNNAATLGLLVLMREPLQALAGGRIDDRIVLLAVGLAAIPLVLMTLRQKIQRSVGAPEMVAALGARTILHGLLTIATWHFALPEVPLRTWLMLIAARMIFSRLPVLPNKELAFAAAVAILLGPHEQIGLVVAGVALLTLVADALMLVISPGAFPWRRSLASEGRDQPILA
ncbi:MAG: hypothetical protein K2X59_00115 [Sphingomonas sp.]|nr:hypothetical protein [Sphingomonas sp.]